MSPTTQPRSIFEAGGTVQHTLDPVGTAIAHVSQTTSSCRVFPTWIRLVTPPHEPPSVEASSTAQLLASVQRLTGWSNRVVAGVLHTSHPTIATIRSEGRDGTKVAGLQDKLVRLEDVVSRLSKLADGNRGLYRAALSATSKDGTSVVEHFTAGAWSRGYLAALDFMNGQKREDEFIQARGTRTPSNELVGLVEDDVN